MKTSKLRCGCVYEIGERERWVQLCPLHEAEWRDTHERWDREHRATEPLPPKATEPKGKRK